MNNKMLKFVDLHKESPPKRDTKKGVKTLMKFMMNL